MTLVLSVATNDYLIQVSDRRLVRPTGELYDDDANKSVLFTDKMAISYSGLGYIEAEKTDIWLTKALSQSPSASLSDALYTLRTAATEAFKKLNFAPDVKRHAFVAVAWTKSAQTELFRPMIAVLSNFHNDQMTPLPEARDNFTLKVWIIPDSAKLGYTSIGQPLLREQEVELVRNLRRFVSHRVSTQIVLNLLVKGVRGVALTNDYVGNGLLSVVIPRAAIETDKLHFTVVTGGPSEHSATFQYYPTTSNQGVILGPNVAGPGTAMTNFKAGSL